MLSPSPTADQQWLTLQPRDRALYTGAYNQGKWDEAKADAWLRRQHPAAGLAPVPANDPPPSDGLQRSYYAVPVPAHPDPVTGTEIEPHTEVIETVTP
jgi:hypothetical protein